jgi:hypothetical protein
MAKLKSRFPALSAGDALKSLQRAMEIFDV